MINPCCIHNGDSMFVVVQRKPLCASLKITAWWGYHSVMCNVCEQKQVRNRPMPSQLGFIMRCLKSWQETGGQFREHETEGLSPWAHTTHLSQDRLLSLALCTLCLLVVLTLFFLFSFDLRCIPLSVLYHCIDRTAQPSLSSVKDLRSRRCFWQENCFPWVSFVRRKLTSSQQRTHHISFHKDCGCSVEIYVCTQASPTLTFLLRGTLCAHVLYYRFKVMKDIID